MSESAKAVQEVAKTTNTAIEATEKLGSFVSRIIGEPIDEVVGMLTDRLKFMRWQRQIRLTERARELIREKDIQGELKTVSPKIALPIIENASLEENDELQDLWAYLIASAVDPNFDGTVRAAFIDIIKQLEVNDVHILNFIYNEYANYNDNYKKRTREYSGSEIKIKDVDGNNFAISANEIMQEVGIDEVSYKESVDNLIRVRCVASFIRTEKLDLRPRNRGVTSVNEIFNRAFRKTDVEFNVTHIYDRVCITALGISFAKACMKPRFNEINVDSE